MSPRVTGYDDNGTSSVLIAETTLAAAAATIEFAAIPQTYDHLHLVLVGRGSDGAAGFAFPALQFNGDTAANYHRQLLRATSSVVDAVEQAAAPNAALGALPTGGVTANVMGAVDVFIPGYSDDSRFKAFQASSTARSGSPGSRFDQNGLAWNSTAAITTITVALSGSSAFAAGSSAHLYGLKGA